MCRVDSELTCCWTIRLGKIVVMHTVGPPHQGSVTTSRIRSSFNCRFSRNVDTPCVASFATAASLRCEIMHA